NAEFLFPAPIVRRTSRFCVCLLNPSPALFAFRWPVRNHPSKVNGSDFPSERSAAGPGIDRQDPLPSDRASSRAACALPKSPCRRRWFRTRWEFLTSSTGSPDSVALPHPPFRPFPAPSLSIDRGIARAMRTAGVRSAFSNPSKESRGSSPCPLQSMHRGTRPKQPRSPTIDARLHETASVRALPPERYRQFPPGPLLRTAGMRASRGKPTQATLVRRNREFARYPDDRKETAHSVFRKIEWNRKPAYPDALVLRRDSVQEAWQGVPASDRCSQKEIARAGPVCGAAQRSRYCLGVPGSRLRAADSRRAEFSALRFRPFPFCTRRDGIPLRRMPPRIASA